MHAYVAQIGTENCFVGKSALFRNVVINHSVLHVVS